MRSQISIPPQALNRGIYMPLYLQLAKQMMENIRSGSWKAGDKIPPELDLVRDLNISRMTVRMAMDELITKGYVYREQGRGTFVAQPPMQGVRGFSSFSEDMHNRGLNHSTQVLSVVEIEPTQDIQKTLKISAGSKVFRIDRLRIVEEIPWAIQRSYISSALAPDLNHEDLRLSLFSILREKHNIYPAWTEAKMISRLSQDTEANLLALTMPAAVLVVKGLTFTDSFEVVESVETVYRGEEVAIHLGRQRLDQAIADY